MFRNEEVQYWGGEDLCLIKREFTDGSFLYKPFSPENLKQRKEKEEKIKISTYGKKKKKKTIFLLVRGCVRRGKFKFETWKIQKTDKNQN